MALTLFPVRAPIGQATDANGKTYDVFMTPEFARALSSLGERLGGMVDPSGLDLAPVGSGDGDALAARVAELEQQIGALQATLAQVVGADVFAPPSTKDNADRGFFPMQWPTKNARGNGSWADLWVPDQKTFVDNVLSLRNNSRAPDGSIYGLAAICMLDAGGTERGAFGYSRNGAIQPNGYYADTVYTEFGDPFSGDNNPSSYKLICTMAATSPWFPGTSFVAMEANAKTGATIIRARGGQPISLAGGYTLTEDASIGYTGNTRQLLGGMATTSWRIRERDNLDSAAWTTNINDGGVQDDPTKPSWKVQQGYGNSDNSFRVARSPAGSAVFMDVLKITYSGDVLLNSGNGVTLIGSAFASTGNGKLQVRENTNQFVIAVKNAASKEWVWGVNNNTMYLRNATDGVNGFFVANGGRLLVGSSIDDGATILQVNGGGIKHGSSTLLSTSVALADASGTAAGTLANAPVAGNPTKWITINDNGTTRRIPTW
jgi:hypothetical protein